MSLRKSRNLAARYRKPLPRKPEWPLTLDASSSQDGQSSGEECKPGDRRGWIDFGGRYRCRVRGIYGSTNLPGEKARAFLVSRGHRAAAEDGQEEN